jgi:hypothetical protein
MHTLRQLLPGAALLLMLADASFSASVIASTSVPRETPARADAPVRLHRTNANPFATRSWVPPPPPAPVVRAVVPKAPPLPFVYLGKMLDGKAVTAFVSMGGQTHLLHGGDTVRDYRVEAISAKEITFVYLPLNEKQRLSFGSEN